MLTAFGYQVSTVDSGSKALETIFSEDVQIDLLLTDISMPGMDGFELTKRCRNLDFDKPIIAVTAHAFDFQKKNCLDAGCNDVLTKPLLMDDLRKTIKKWLH